MKTFFGPNRHIFGGYLVYLIAADTQSMNNIGLCLTLTLILTLTLVVQAVPCGVKQRLARLNGMGKYPTQIQCKAQQCIRHTT